MKKKFIILLIAILLLPTIAFAEKINLEDYTSLNLEETLKDEQSYNADFTYDLTGYTENDNQITIYVFRGKGCPHCEDFLSYLGNDLVKNYGSYFKVVSFQTWGDTNEATNNNRLLTKVGNFLNFEKTGAVPLIIIGDQHFLGYGESSNAEIESAIMSLYNSSDRYDIFEEMSKEEKTTDKTSNASIIIWNIIIAVIGVLIVVAHNNYIKNEIINALDKKTK